MTHAWEDKRDDKVRRVGVGIGLEVVSFLRLFVGEKGVKKHGDTLYRFADTEITERGEEGRAARPGRGHARGR
jgi:hypothetical protein